MPAASKSVCAAHYDFMGDSGSQIGGSNKRIGPKIITVSNSVLEPYILTDW